MPTTIGQCFPEELAVLARVDARMATMAEIRTQRKKEVACQMSYRDRTERLEALRVRMDIDALRSAEQRAGTAFSVLHDEDRAIVELGLEDAETYGQFSSFEGEPRGRALLNILRANYLAEPNAVSPVLFRNVARNLFAMAIEWMSAQFPKMQPRYELPPPKECVIVLPWRAALLCGEVYRGAGAVHIWHIGAKRNEQTLATEVYHESPPPPETRDAVHIICDPMLASGGTTLTAMTRLVSAGVRPDRTIVQSIIAAPEGVDRILAAFPDCKAFTCALDEGLDRNGYIVPGLGDFGDLAFADLDERYVQERWLESGLLTRAQADLICQRTQAIRDRAHAP